MQYKFRGRDKETGLYWRYGSLVQTKSGYYIISNDTKEDSTYYGSHAFVDSDEVMPETIGMFTGLHDKKGNEVYLGDIVKLDDTPDAVKGTDLVDPEDISHHEIIWLPERAMFYDIRIEDGDNLCSYLDDDISWVSDGVVIGNKWDNPELLNK